MLEYNKYTIVKLWQSESAIIYSKTFKFNVQPPNYKNKQKVSNK